MFLDIERDTQRLQVMVELKKLLSLDASLEDGFKSFKKVARTGDWICACFLPSSLTSTNST